MALNFLNNATFTGSVTVQGDGIDIDNDDNVRLRFDNLSTFEAGLQVATTSGDMIAGSAINDFAIRSQGNMLFASGGNTERMRIDTIGNVGIGTDNPGALLHVKAATNVTGTIEVQGGKAQVTAAGEINAELNFGSNDGSATGGIGGSIKSVTENTNGAYVGMSFYTAKQGRTPVLKEAMRIDKDGFVGIGTTSPDRLLDLEGDLAVIKLNTTSATADTFIDFETEGINRFRVGYDKSDDAFKIAKTNNNSNNFTVNYGTGNVGIGSNSPVGKLYVGPTCGRQYLIYKKPKHR